jgi:hypothetical protein
MRIGSYGHRVPIVVYRPAHQTGPLPAVVFLPARSAPEWMYESYGRELASRGFVVAVRGWYSFFRTDPELAHDARRIADWLLQEKLADPAHLAVAGHSMGGKCSIMAALDDPRFSAVVAIDPDENGKTWVARGPIERLHAPLLVIGMELAVKAIRLCATPDGNFRSFFPHAPPGTIEMTVLGADHVQPMDKPDYPGMGICRVGTADSETGPLHGARGDGELPRAATPRRGGRAAARARARGARQAGRYHFHETLNARISAVA